MPPRVAPRGGRGGRGGGRPPRGGPLHESAPPVNAPGIPSSLIQTIGVRRTATGTGGYPIELQTNHFVVEIPEDVIHHYDGEFHCSQLYL